MFGARRLFFSCVNNSENYFKNGCKHSRDNNGKLVYNIGRNTSGMFVDSDVYMDENVQKTYDLTYEVYEKILQLDKKMDRILEQLEKSDK